MRSQSINRRLSAWEAIVERFKRGLKGSGSRTTDRRRAELAKIHILTTQAGLDRETYEAMLMRLADVDSSAKLDDAGRGRVIGYLTRITGHRDHGAASHNLRSKPLLGKIEALLADGAKPWAYADALALRICKKARLAFCGDAELVKIVAALAYDAQRRHRAETDTHA